MGNHIMFWISFVFLLGASAIFGYLDKNTAMAGAIVTGCAGMAFGRLSQFSRIKAGAFEGELRKAVDEAYATAESLKELSVELTRPILGIIASGGRFGGMGLRRKMEMRQGIDRSLANLGISESEITGAHEMFDKYFLCDHASRIDKLMNTERKSNPALQAAIKGLYNYRDLSVAGTEEFRQVQESYDLINPELSEEIEDLDYFRRHGEFRRPAVWLKDNDE